MPTQASHEVSLHAVNAISPMNNGPRDIRRILWQEAHLVSLWLRRVTDHFIDHSKHEGLIQAGLDLKAQKPPSPRCLPYDPVVAWIASIVPQVHFAANGGPATEDIDKEVMPVVEQQHGLTHQNGERGETRSTRLEGARRHVSTLEAREELQSQGDRDHSTPHELSTSRKSGQLCEAGDHSTPRAINLRLGKRKQCESDAVGVHARLKANHQKQKVRLWA